MARNTKDTQNTSKRVSAKKAELLRTKRIIELLDVDCFVAPTPKVDSGANGKVTEFYSVEENSQKSCISKPGQVDVYRHFLDGDKRVRKGVEIKTNGGEITAIYNALQRGRDGLVVYFLDVCNSNTSGKRRTVSPRIMHYSTFWSLLENAGAIRYTKVTTNGRQVMAIEPTKKALVNLLEQMTEWDDSRLMELAEIQ